MVQECLALWELVSKATDKTLAHTAYGHINTHINQKSTPKNSLIRPCAAVQKTRTYWQKGMKTNKETSARSVTIATTLCCSAACDDIGKEIAPQS